MNAYTASTLVAVSIIAAWCLHDFNKTSEQVSRDAAATACFEATKRPACGFWMDGTDTTAYGTRGPK